MNELISEGHVYIAQAPLYRIQKGNRFRYAYSDEERDRILAEFGDGPWGHDAAVQGTRGG
ncbi:hypothetical protein B2A_14544 [mine drainage metagenome]|uniref:DNA topoisomerase (ATP-hydrolyzing) n=1 Tax=mine drainage metagenome TaxID=410659 RepID=T0ZHL2_9ZZZZ